VEQDPLLSFLSNLSQKINIEKEHKAIMEGLEAPETVTPLAVTLANLLLTNLYARFIDCKNFLFVLT